jgi:hypothetical protein
VMGVLLDDREQIGEQPLLDLGELGALDRRLVVATPGGPIDLVHRRAQRGDQRRAPARRRDAGGPPLGPDVGASQPLGRGFALLRNCRPSSYRLA